jgi:hypothetical protein
MEISMATVRVALQRGLLDTITPNIRLITTSFTEHSLDIYFYYDNPPNEDEVGLSEKVSTEVLRSFRDMPSAAVHRIVLPEPKMLPQIDNDIPVYARWEKPPPS